MIHALYFESGKTPEGFLCMMEVSKAAVFVVGEICLARASLHNLLVIRI
jgi:hypothetical protein